MRNETEININFILVQVRVRVCLFVEAKSKSESKPEILRESSRNLKSCLLLEEIERRISI